VNDGAVAVKTYKEGEFDLFITDIIMPEKEGLATIREVRMHDPAARIIAISGGGLINLYDLLKAASLMGAQKILPKPFTAEELEFAIVELMKN
jgi:YesN/AraC family two-component response regulator